MSIRAPLLRNIFWLLIDRGTRLLIAFFVGVLVARRLGPELFGLFNYAQASVGILGFLGTLGIEAIVIKQLVEQPEKRDEILGSAFFLRLLGGLLIILGGGALAFIQRGEHPVLLRIVPFIAGASLLQSFDVIDLWLRMELSSRYSVLARFFALLIGGALRIAAIETAAPLFALAVAIFVEASIVALSLTWVLRYSSTRLCMWQPNLARMYDILLLSWPILLSGAAVAVYSRFGVILLGNYQDQAQVGVFGVANVISEAFHAIPAAVMASYGPILLAQYRASADEFSANLFHLLRQSVPLSILISVIVAWNADWLISLLFDDRYAASGPVLTLLIWSIVFVYISTVSEIWFIAHGVQRYFLPKTLIAAAVSIVLNILLIPRYGVQGAVWSTLISYSVTAFWANGLFKVTRPLFWQQCRAFLLLKSAE